MFTEGRREPGRAGTGIGGGCAEEELVELAELAELAEEVAEFEE